MRLAYVFPHFPARSETFAASDIRSLQELGAEVEVYNLRPSDEEAPALLEQWGMEALRVEQITPAGLAAGLGYAVRRPGLFARGVWTTLRDNAARPRHLAKGLLVLPSIYSALRRLERSRPDVVHLFWGHYPAALGVLARRVLPSAVVTTFLGAYDLVEEYQTSVTLAEEADRVFTHARVNLTALQALGVDPSKVTVVHRGIDLARLRPSGTPKVSRRVAAVGRFTEEKGFVNVVETFARVQALWPDATLHLVGDGPQRPELEALVAERGLTGVSFTGFVSHQRVFEELEAAEVCLHLSEAPCERLPNAVKEAMVAGCVCIASHTPGIEELIHPGEHGFVAGSRDWDEVARHVATVFSEREERERLSENARAHVEASFDTRKNMGTYLEVWRGLAAGRGQESIG